VEKILMVTVSVYKVARWVGEGRRRRPVLTYKGILGLYSVQATRCRDFVAAPWFDTFTQEEAMQIALQLRAGASSGQVNGMQWERLPNPRRTPRKM
jgi:hypothetical protein